MSDQTQDSSDHPEASRDYLDFKLEISPGHGNEYSIAVDSPAGQTRTRVAFPFDEIALERYLDKLQIALLRRRGGHRLAPSEEEKLVQEFGGALFDFLLSGEIRSRFDVSYIQAAQQNKGLRLSLRIQPPELASLPWEFLYDQRQGEYLCLTAATPIVRYLELPRPIQPLAAPLPLRILGMIAAPTDLPKLDVQGEKERLKRALVDLQSRGLVQLTWLPGATWRDLQRAMRPRQGPWHIFHFVGHGDYDSNTDEGLIFLEKDDRAAERLGATQLARLLADHPSLRLALLNACEGARGGRRDIFSSTASILVRRGLPAVLAMQYPITDRAAIELSRSFYEALADGLPVDACVAEARKAISIAIAGSLEWGTPVLYLRAADGVLFHLQPPARASTAETSHAIAKSPDLVTPGPTITIAPPPARAPTPKPQELPGAELTLELASGVPITFVRVPAGEFWMGSDKKHDPDAYDNETPLHTLSLDEYWVGKYPVTNLQYLIYVLATKSRYPSHWKSGRIPQGKDQHPVVNVNWHEARDFCKWFSQRVKGYLVRLPSEAEWEKAARGGVQIPRLQDGCIAALVDNPNWQRIYPWGDEPPHNNLCNFNMNEGDTTPVGRYSPQGDSPYGCADMAGNVWEWTNSKDANYPYRKDDGREAHDETSRRVLRGGSFGNYARSVRCAVRCGHDPVYRVDHLGFRVVLSPI